MAALLASLAHAANEPTPAANPNGDELAMIFRPFETTGMTMSPDGRYLAYTSRQGDELYLVFRDLDHNTVKRLYVAQAKESWSGVRGKVPARLTFMRWAADDRLVFNLNRENVWSMTMAGDAQPLVDIRTFAPPAPTPTVRVVSSDSDGEVSLLSIAVVPPDPLLAARDMEQPVEIATMRRGDRYVYVQGLMKSRGVGLEVNPLNNMVTEPRLPGETPRVVLRVDTATGNQEEWGSAPESSALLCDQSGYPRVILQRDNFHRAQTIGQAFLFAPAKSADWTPLDARIQGPALGFHLEPTNVLGERSLPLGFDFDGTTMYFASNVGHDTYGIYALDTRTWQRTNFALESKVADLVDPIAEGPEPDKLVFDIWTKKLVGVRYLAALRTTLWLDPELRQVQQTLDRLDATKQWQILEWDQARSAYLVEASGLSDPGTFCVYYPAQKEVTEVMERAPWMTEVGRNPSVTLTLKAKDGTPLTCYVTAPRHPRIKRPPVVVLCHDGPWSRDYPDYDRDSQALAAMGFIVLRVNYRGSAGFGRRSLEALRDGNDALAVDDLCAAVDAITAEQGERRLVAIMGHGFGGYLALRATQLHPDTFRCAIAIDAPVDLPTWIDTPDRFVSEQRTAYFGRDTRRLGENSPLAHAERITLPTLLVESDRAGAMREQDLAAKLRHLDREVTYVRLSANESVDLPEAHAALFRRINEFLNVNVYRYAVKLGLAVKVPDAVPPPLPTAPHVAPIVPPPSSPLERPSATPIPPPK
jgi:dipeptidyl aminopeptidase/acylaminoacyl peptidase